MLQQIWELIKQFIYPEYFIVIILTTYFLLKGILRNNLTASWKKRITAIVALVTGGIVWLAVPTLFCNPMKMIITALVAPATYDYAIKEGLKALGLEYKNDDPELLKPS